MNVRLSVHIADVGARAVPGILLSRPRTPGLRYATTTVAAPLGAGLVPKPQLGRVGLIAAWDDDAALDAFLDGDPLARRLAGGWHARLEPLRASGAWRALPELSAPERAVDDDEPVAVLTLGRLRLTRTLPFLRTSAQAEGRAVADPAVEFSPGLARPPRLVSTFSLWHSAAAMKDYAYGRSGAGHLAAIQAHRARAFHHESLFARFRPYAQQGTLP